MNNLQEEKLTKEDYDKIPVYYCVTCGSLKVRMLPGSNEDYCDDCGSFHISKASIFAWLDLQKTKYRPIYKERHVREEKIIIRRNGELL